MSKGPIPSGPRTWLRPTNGRGSIKGRELFTEAREAVLCEGIESPWDLRDREQKVSKVSSPENFEAKDAKDEAETRNRG